MGECHEEVEKADGAHMLGAEGNGLGGIAEHCDKLRRKQIGKPTDDRCHCAAARNAKGDAFFDSGMVSRTQILTHEGGQSLSKAGHRQKSKALQLGVRAAACHGCLAKAVDVGLHHHICQSNDAVLDAGGQTVADDLHQTFLVKADLADLHPVRGIDAQNMQKAQQRADSLGDGGGKCRGAHAKAQRGNEQHIQSNVDKGGEDQIVEGMLAVAHGVENTHENVVHHREDGTAEVEAEILNGLGKHLFGGAHPLEDQRCQGNAHYGEGSACRQTEGNGGVDGFAHGVVILCTEGSGNDHARTHGDAVEEADHHKDQTS